MPASFASVALVAAGTPQRLNTVTPAMPSQIIQGVTYAGGSATQRYRQITFQAAPGNTGANLYLMGPGMTKAGGVGYTLVKAAAPLVLTAESASLALDDIWLDGDTAGDKLSISMVG